MSKRESIEPLIEQMQERVKTPAGFDVELKRVLDMAFEVGMLRGRDSYSSACAAFYYSARRLGPEATYDSVHAALPEADWRGTRRIVRLLHRCDLRMKAEEE